MTTDSPGIIHSGEIWQKSQCLLHEEQLVASIYKCLQKNNYQNINPISHTRSCWQRDQHKIVISLVDDLWDCAQDRTKDTPYLFDCDTTVVTDNFLNCPSVYQLYKTPPSFYGIYSYVPDNQIWNPTRDYTFAINRLDFKRMRILLQLYCDLTFDAGYVNFNCQIGGMQVATKDQRRQVFVNEALKHSADLTEQQAFKQLSTVVPIKNHQLAHDHAYTQSWLNIIVETYSSDNVISMSEKIFRCLVTPAPWIAYAGRYTIAKLRELGFDVMDDIIDHNYDQLLEVQYKISKFIESGKHTIFQTKRINWEQVKSRCQVAALNNQKLLDKLSSEWNENQSAWLQQFDLDIK